MYEDYSQSRLLSIDCETKDPDLLTKGPGVYRSVPLDFKNDNGYLLGVSLTDENGRKGYYNLGHYDCTEELRHKNLKYLAEVMATMTTKIGTHLMYDLDWIENWGLIPIAGQLIDITIAEALLDEYQHHYNLDFMGEKYIGEGKSNQKLLDFCYNNGLKLNKKKDPRPWLWKMPFYLVEEYAIQDVELPMQIWKC